MSKNRDNQPSVNPFLASLSLKPITRLTEWTMTKGMDAPASLSIPTFIDPSKGSWYNMEFGVLHQYGTAALQVLGYVLSHLRWDKDYLELKYDKIGMARSSFYRGVTELIDRGILADRSARVSTYWINPDKFFYGSRLKSFPDNIVKDEPDFVESTESSSGIQDQSHD